MSTYVAIGPYCWGKGSTLEIAVKNAKQNWSHLYGGPFRKAKLSIFLTDDPDPSIGDIDGSIWVHKPFTLEKVQTSSLAK